MHQQEERQRTLHTVNVEMVKVPLIRSSSLKRVRDDEEEVKEGKIKNRREANGQK